MLKVIGEEVKSRNDLCCIFSRYGSALRRRQTIEDRGVRRKEMDGPGIEQNKKWIKEGKMKYSETMTEGFDNIFKAFADMLKGGNVGKAVVKA